MEDLQLGLPGPRAQNPSIVFRDTRNEPEPVPILLRQMVATNAWGLGKRIKIVPHKLKDAPVKKNCYLLFAQIKMFL